MKRPRVLWLGVESTDYLRDEFRGLETQLPYEFEFAFLGKNLTQQWGGNEWRVISRKEGRLPGPLEFGRFLLAVALEPPAAAVLEGYGTPHFVVLAFLLQILRVPWVLRSDTSYSSRSERRSFLKRRLLSWMLNRARWLLPGGGRQREHLRRLGAPPERMSLGYMSVESARYAKREEASAPACPALPTAGGSPLRLVSIGRLIRRKGMDAAIFAVIRMKQLGLEVRLEIAGNGPEQERLVDLAKEAGEQVSFLGRIDQSGIAQALGRADAFILLAKEEPWGLVVNEALAAGLPVIVGCDVGCADDLVRHGENGFLVDPEDPEQVDAAIFSLARSSEMRKAMGQNSLKIAACWGPLERLGSTRRALERCLS
jgi:glycosyltransferase involved in cell wall biosynthesis